MHRSEDDRKSHGVSGLPSVFQLADPAELEDETRATQSIPAQREAVSEPDPTPSIRELEEQIRAGAVRRGAIDVLPAPHPRGPVGELLDRAKRKWGVRY